jgi:hypothetical protein
MRTSLRLCGGVALALVGFVACGDAGGSNFGSDDAGTKDGAGGHGDSSSSGGDGGIPMLLVDSGKGDGASSDVGVDAAAECPVSATLVYVTGPGAHLWSFYPPTLKFTDIGPMTCLSSPTHMTVDRQGNAWVVSEGKIYKASTTDASCAAVPTWTPHPALYGDFALSFIGVTSAIDDSLYMLGTSSLGLFDVASGTVTTIGAAPVPDPIGDMTSNGDGTLYFLHDVEMLMLFNLDPKTAAVISKVPIGATGGGDQALAFWGGSFYAFENDIIYQYDPKMATTMSLGMAPLSVTGAGQSTCVPKVPPPPPPPPP